MDQQLVIKLTSGDGNGTPIGLVESPPMLYSNFKLLFPEVAFSDIATPSEIEPHCYGVFEWNYEPMPHEIPYNKNVVKLGLIKNSQGIWRPEFELIDASDEEVKERTIIKAELQREKRDNQLRLTDWTELPISNLTENQKLAYNTYRQALRDYPSQAGFPWSATFPKHPKDE